MPSLPTPIDSTSKAMEVVISPVAMGARSTPSAVTVIVGTSGASFSRLFTAHRKESATSSPRALPLGTPDLGVGRSKPATVSTSS